jgi:excisionase family DNA binding protein
MTSIAVTLALSDEAIAALVAELAAQIGIQEPLQHSSPWMTLTEACEHLRWPKHRVYKLTSARAIPHVKHEGRLLFHRGELDAWLNQYHEG